MNMETVLIKPENKKDAFLLLDLARRLGMQDKIINTEDLEETELVMLVSEKLSENKEYLDSDEDTSSTVVVIKARSKSEERALHDFAEAMGLEAHFMDEELFEDAYLMKQIEEDNKSGLVGEEEVMEALRE